MNTAAPMGLRDLQILVIDCQATTSRPETGFLLEIGWGKIRASEICDAYSIEPSARAFLLSPPRNTAVPPQALRITGIQMEDLKTYRPARDRAGFPLGPFTSTRHALPLGSLMDLFNGDFRRISSRVIQNILDLSLEYIPERNVFKQGLRDLQQKYPVLVSGSVDIAVLKSLGAQLWRDRLLESLRDSEDPELETDTEEDKKSTRDYGPGNASSGY